MRPLLAALTLLHATRADLNTTNVFRARTYNHACYRVPNAVRAPSGALLVFVEARGPSCDDQAPKDVMLARSRDAGATWSAPEMVVPGGSLGGNLTFRNPYPVFTAAGVLVLQVANSTREPWHSLQLTSTDEGLTWTPPAPLAPSLGPFDGILNGPGSGLLLTQPPHAGGLLTCGTTVYNAGAGADRLTQAVVTLSTDDGASWQTTQVWTASAGAGAVLGECQMAELRNGSVLANFRNQFRRPCDCRISSRSDDGGRTWSPLADAPALIEPVCSAGLQQTAAGLFFSNPASTSARVNMTVRKSLDGGDSWPRSVQVYAGVAEYSVLVPVGDPALGGVGIVFERDGYGAISFAVVPEM